MHVLVETQGATAVLTIMVPRFNETVSEQIRSEALAALRDEVQTYLVNMEHVAHISSAAVGVLVHLMKRIGRNRRLELCAPSPAVRKVLRLTRMDAIFRIHATVGEAVEQLIRERRQNG